jgi:Cu/Ag efflux pump CusA
MAFAMIGGIIAATLLTLFFLPALYVACFRIREPAEVKTSMQPKGVTVHV